MQKKRYHQIKDLQERVMELHEKGISGGQYLGWECLKDYYSIKLGCTSYIYGHPYSGKTEWYLEVLVNLSIFYGWKHAIFTPETGTKEQITAELVHKYSSKPFYKKYADHISENELYGALAWLNEHFYIVDPEDEDLTVKGFFETVDELEKDLDVRIHTTMCDPFNELLHSFKEFENRQDVYLENILGFIRRNARKHSRHNAIVTHSQYQTLNKDGFYDPPYMQQMSGGQAWSRKGEAIVCVYRPPFGQNDENGIPYAENETHIIIQKAKPKGIGKKGVAKLFYNFLKARYYEDYYGIERYAAIQQETDNERKYQNRNFYEPTSGEDAPF